MDSKLKHQNTIKLINLYRSYPILWDMNNKSYRCNDLKAEAYEEIAKNMGMKPENVRKKIRSLRVTYTGEKRKVKMKKSGSGAEENYEPSLKWFDQMSFLDSSIVIRKTMDNSAEFENDTANGKRRNNSDDLIALAAKQLQQGQNRFEKLAETWAIQLEEMDPHQRIFAEKFVSDILFEGKMGTLHRDAISFNINHTYTTVTTSKSIPLSNLNESKLANNEKFITEIKEECIQDDIDIGEQKLSYELYECEKSESIEYPQ